MFKIHPRHCQDETLGMGLSWICHPCHFKFRCMFMCVPLFHQQDQGSILCPHPPPHFIFTTTPLNRLGNCIFPKSRCRNHFLAIRAVHAVIGSPTLEVFNLDFREQHSASTYLHWKGGWTTWPPNPNILGYCGCRNDYSPCSNDS